MKNKIILFCLLSFNSLYAQVLFPSEAYDLALKNSNQIQSSTFKLEAKKEDLNQWYSKYYPQIDFTIDYNDTDFEYNELTNRTNYDITEKSLDTALSLRQSLYNNETITKIDLEKKRIKLYEIGLKKEQQKLSTEVFNYYFTALNSKNKIRLLNSYRLLNEQKLKAVEKRYKMTISSKMDLLEASVELSRSKIDLIKEEKLYKSYILKLAQLTNVKDIELPKINFEKFELSSIINNKVLLKNENIYLQNNLEYKEANESVNLANLELQNAKSSHYPKLDFDARYTKFDSDDITTDYENSMRWSVKLTIPLYTGGYVSSRVKSAKISQQSSFEDLEVVKKDLTLKHDELLSLLNTSIQSVEVYKEALRSSQSYLEFTSQGYSNGLKSLIDLYNARSKIFEIKYEYIKNIQEFIQVYVEYLILNNDVQKLKQIDSIIKKG